MKLTKMYLSVLGLSTMFVCLIISPFALAQDLSERLAEDGVPELYQKASASTVLLRLIKPNGKVSIGTGFFIPSSTHTYIVTNYHVVIGATQGTANIVNKAETYPIESIVAKDPENDLAILQVAIPSIKPLPLGDSDKMKEGMRVYTVGNPKGLEGTFSEGYISSISRRTANNKKRLQFTAPISRGSSGGPLLNKDQEVIGIAYMSYIDGQDLNFAIPSNYVKELLKAEGLVTPLPQAQKNLTAKDYYWRGVSNFLNGFNRSGISDPISVISAISDFNEVIRLKPDSFWAKDSHMLRGQAKLGLHQYAEAILDFNQAIKRDPNYAQALSVYYWLGRAKIGLKQYKQAIADLDVFIGKHSKTIITWEGYYYRGKAKSLRGDYDAAITDFYQSIIRNPEHAESYYYRGEAKRRSEQHSELEARADYTIAILVKPDFHEAYYARAKSYYSQGRLYNVKKDVKDALKIATEAEHPSKRRYEYLLDKIIKEQQSE